MYAVEAESGTGFTPSTAVWDVSGYQRAGAVMEPLTAARPDGTFAGFLAESVIPDAEHRTWTIRVRDGIEFHNGEPLNAEAVKQNIEANSRGLLTGQYLPPIASVHAADERTVVVRLTEPYVALPAVLSTQAGYIIAPEQLERSRNSADAAYTIPPVGTGPFVFDEYTAGSTPFRAERNPRYWRKDSDGNRLPYLDAVEFRTLPDSRARLAALRSGDVDVALTSSDMIVSSLTDDPDGIKFETFAQFTDTSYVILNVTKPPLDDIRVRRALAISVDHDAVNRVLGVDTVARRANGPFPPGTVGHLDDTGYPSEYDPAEARRLINEYKAEKGVSTVSFSYMTVPDPDALRRIQLDQAYWKAVGIEVPLNQVEQSTYINLALAGDFHAFRWRNHWGSDPSMQSLWWTSDNSGDSFALNFGRFRDPTVDSLVSVIDSSDRPAERRHAAEQLNRRLGEQVYNLWDRWTTWTVAHAPDVHGVTEATLPDGTPAAVGIGGHHPLTTTWHENRR